MDAASTWAAIGAFGTVATTVVAAWAARQSRNAAIKANEAAGSLAAIELQRHHDEIAPEFDLRFVVTGRSQANLRVALVGGLESLDEVTFTILDETGKDHWAGGLPGRLTQEEAEAFVWGPWEFNAMAAHQVVSNRQSRSRAYSRVTGKNWDLLPLRRTEPGHWMTTYSQQQWQDEYQDQPIRLLITSRRSGYEPWTQLREAVTEPGPQDREQASQIRVRAETCDGGLADVLPKDMSKLVHMLVVTNASSRPIRNLAAQIEVFGGISPGKKLANVVGRIQATDAGTDAGYGAGGYGDVGPVPTTETFVPVTHGDRRDLLDAGQTIAFAWAFDVETYPNTAFTIRFADDRGQDWEVGPALRPKTIYRDW
jgi:hypothetical protein